jgi:hypothetical protein
MLICNYKIQYMKQLLSHVAVAWRVDMAVLRSLRSQYFEW